MGVLSSSLRRVTKTKGFQSKPFFILYHLNLTTKSVASRLLTLNMQKTFNIKGRDVVCEINRLRRKTLALYVHPDKRVEIRMPLFFNVNEIEPFLVKHSRWLFNRLDVSVNKTIEPKKFVSGELHYFLGKQYPIEVNAASKNSVLLKDDIIYISHRAAETLNHQDVVEKLLDCWYIEQAKRVFKECAEPLIKRMEKYNVAPKSFTIRKMKTRWGSCSRKGSISLNLHLIKLPEQCIKEVILHELCHLVHFNHSKEFYTLMTAEMPDWKNWKKELKFL